MKKSQYNKLNDDDYESRDYNDRYRNRTNRNDGNTRTRASSVDREDDRGRSKKNNRSQEVDDVREGKSRFLFYKIEAGRRNSLPDIQSTKYRFYKIERNNSFTSLNNQKSGPKYIFFKIEPNAEGDANTASTVNFPKFKVFKIEKGNGKEHLKEPFVPKKQTYYRKIYCIEKGDGKVPEPVQEPLKVEEKLEPKKEREKTPPPTEREKTPLIKEDVKPRTPTPQPKKVEKPVTPPRPKTPPKARARTPSPIERALMTKKVAQKISNILPPLKTRPINHRTLDSINKSMMKYRF